MAKLQLIIDDNLMKTLKLHALTNETTIKDIVTSLLEEYFDSSIKESNDSSIIKSKNTNTRIQKSNDTKIKESFNQTIKLSNDTSIKESKPHQYSTFYDDPKPKYPSPLDPDYAEDPMDERYFYVLRKTFATYLHENDEQDNWMSNESVSWLLPKGCRYHKDNRDELIPFRYSLPTLQSVEPTQEQIQELERAYGKPVTIEK